MTPTPSLVFVAGAFSAVLLLGACATAPADTTETRLDDIVRIPLAPRDRTDDDVTGARGGIALAPSRSVEPERVRGEETLRRELGVDHAPDGSWDGCFRRGWGEGC